jgi:hypothetical protein
MSFLFQKKEQKKSRKKKRRSYSTETIQGETEMLTPFNFMIRLNGWTQQNTIIDTENTQNESEKSIKTLNFNKS